MARKLRLEKGDLVTLKTSFGQGFAVGRVAEITQNKKEDWKNWGVYGYTIYWSGNDIPSNTGWTITDITSGRLKYLKDKKAIEALFGQVQREKL